MRFVRAMSVSGFVLYALDGSGEFDLITISPMSEGC